MNSFGSQRKDNYHSAQKKKERKGNYQTSSSHSPLNKCQISTLSLHMAILYHKTYINRGHRIIWTLMHHYHPQVIDFYTTKISPLHSKFAALIPTYSASSSAPNCSSRTASSSKFRTRAWLTKPSSSLACICLPPNLKRKKSLIQNAKMEKKRKKKTSWNNNTISKRCQPTYTSLNFKPSYRDFGNRCMEAKILTSSKSAWFTL